MEFPLWVVASIGKHVELVRGYEGPCEVYPPFHRGLLCGVQFDDDSGACHALVALDLNDSGYLENFAFEDIRPSPAVSFDVDLDRGLLVVR